MSFKIITQDRTLKTLALDDGEFAILKDLTDDRDFVYEFRYTVNTVMAILKKVKSVRVSVLPRRPKPTPHIFEPSTQQSGPNPHKVDPTTKLLAQTAPVQREQPINADTIVSNILTQPARLKAAKLANQKLSVKSVCSDTTARISNVTAASVAVRPPKKAALFSNFTVAATDPVKKIILKQSSQLREESAVAPILQATKLIKPPLTNTQNSPARLAISSLSQGVDPTEALKTRLVVNTAKAMKGVIQESEPEEQKKTSAITLAKNVMSSAQVVSTLDINDDAFVPVVIQENQPNVAVTATLAIREEDVEGDAFYVKLELVNNENITIEQKIKKVNHGHLLNLFFMPTIPPKVRVSQFKTAGRNVLEIIQKDPTATSVRIYRKTILPTRQLSTLRYQLAQEIEMTAKDGLQTFIDPTNNISRIIYRVVPVGPTGVQGFEFSNVVAQPVRFRGAKIDNRHAFSVLVATPSESGVKISVSSISPGPIALKVVRRDITIYEQKFLTTIEHIDQKKKVVLLDDLGVAQSFVDSDVKQGHIYEYCAILIFADGDEEVSGRDIIEFSPLSTDVVGVNTTDPEVVSTVNGVDVRFKVSSTINQREMDKVKTLLEKQGLASLFEEQLLTEKDKLGELIAHKIERVNLTTGEKEQFATFTGEEFSDIENQKVSSVKPIQTGHSYTYLVSTLLRSSETMFEKYEKIAIDPTSNKEYSLKPSRFLHPETLSRGNIVTKASLQKNHAKGAFEFGSVGNVHAVPVSLKNTLPEVSNAQVKNIGANKNLVSWDVSGNKEDVDHFIVVQRRLRMDEVVGKAHAITDSGRIEFVDQVDNDEIGEITYKIIPVFNTYRRGSAVSTSEIII